jgi:hypothetical protein
VFFSTVTGNRRPSGSGVGIELANGAGCVLRTSIVWGHTTDVAGGAYTNQVSLVGTPDPLFLANGSWDTLGTPSTSDDVWLPGDYRLQAASPAVGAGGNDPSHPTEDYAGAPRPAGVFRDLGAFERQP